MKGVEKVVNEMSDKELTTTLIDTYTNLSRILASENMRDETEYQLKVVKAKLESMGIITSDLDKRQTATV